MNDAQVQIPTDVEGAEALQDLKPGDDFCLSYLHGKVTANDNGMLTGTVTEMEVKEDECGPMEGNDSGDSEDASDQSSPDEGSEKPAAVIAVGMMKKKPSAEM